MTSSTIRVNEAFVRFRQGDMWIETPLADVSVLIDENTITSEGMDGTLHTIRAGRPTCEIKGLVAGAMTEIPIVKDEPASRIPVIEEDRPAPYGSF